MSVSLLPSTLYTHIRSLLHSLSQRSPHAPVGDLRSELSSCIRLYGNAARFFALQIATHDIEQHFIASTSGQSGSSAGHAAQQSKALEQFLADELAELQRREPFKWTAILAKVVESAEPHMHTAHTAAGAGKDDSFVGRFASSAGLSLRHSLALAVQLNRSPMSKLQHAGLHFLAQHLAWTNLANISQENKAWASMPEELLHDLSYLVTSHPAFALEQKQSILSALAKIVPSDAKREAKLREEQADLVAGVSQHTNAGSTIAEVLCDLGYSISSTVESFKETLHPFPKLTEQDVASIIIMILRTQFARLHGEGGNTEDAASSNAAPAASSGKGGKKGGSNKSPAPVPSKDASSMTEGWQITNVIDAIKELSAGNSSNQAGKLNWKNILENEIDQKKFFILDEKMYSLYVEIYRYATTSGGASSASFHMPLDFMLREWKNTAGHLSLLRFALPSSITVFSYLPPSLQSNAYALRNSKSILAAANGDAAAAAAQAAAEAGEADQATTVMTLSSNAGGKAGESSSSSSSGASSRYQSWLSVDLLDALLDSIPSWSPSSASVTPSSNASASQSLYASLRSMISVALDRAPELLLSGLLSIRPKSKHSVVKDELVSCLVPVHLSITPHPSVAQSFQKLWEASPINGQASPSKIANFWIIKYWMITNTGLETSNGITSPNMPAGGLLPPLLVSLGYALKSFLEKLLQSPSSPFTMDLFTSNTTLANQSSSGPVSFGQWFVNKYQTDHTSSLGKELFLSVMFNYIRENLLDVSNATAVPSHDAGVLPFRLSVETCAIFFKTVLSLPNAPSSLMNDMQNYFASVSGQFQQFQPSHMNMIGSTITLNAGANQFGGQNAMNTMSHHPSQHTMAMGGIGGAGNIGHTNTGMNQLLDTSLTAGAGAGPSHGGNASSGGPPDEIEEEANSYFQKIYTGAMSLDQMVDMLLRFKVSSVKRERDVSTCMIHNLFDEYRFFHKYPARELQITGLLFGALIQNKLVSNFTLGIALRFVLEALRKAPDSKMFSFGLWAISQFKSRIANWPQYAMLILHIPQLQQSQPDLYAFFGAIVQTHQSQGTLEHASGEVDFSTTGSSAFGVGFHSDAQSFSNFANLSEAERHADLAAATAKASLDRASAAANISIDASAASHLPPGLGLTKAGAPSTPGPALAAGLMNSTGTVANPAGTIGGRGSIGGAAPITAVTGAQPPGAAGAAPGSSFGSTLNIDSLLSAEGDAPLPLAPSEGLKDKIHWIINNVTKSNMRQKGRELKLVLRSEYLPYFSRYLVIKRVSIEANFQRLYAAFLDYVGVADLRKIMLETTYYNIQVLLRNDKIVSSSSERSLLKNLGSWLGLLTIAKNKPIRAKYLDLKTLILEAYDTGRLIAVIPFAAKVLESCADSRVFKPPNPWLMAVVGLLREIFDLPGLKLNLKFEIEVLFNHLVINMKEVRSTTLLKHRPLHLRDIRMEREEKQRSATTGPMRAVPLLPNPLPPLPKAGSLPPLKSSLTSAGVRSPSPNMNEEQALSMNISGGGAFGPPAGATGTGAPLTGQGNADSLLIPNLSQYVVISSTIALFQMYPALKRCVPTAIDRAIREIINPVVERSLAIACVTSRELVLKDFALEPDENKMRLASNSMVSNLTSSLALVTCREPLRVSITNHLNQLLEANTRPEERQLVERACLQISSDNLELGTTLIEKAAAERAIREIDEQLAPVYQMRRKHRESTGQPYVDLSFSSFGNRYPAALPEVLRAKPGAGLQPSQLRVYDDFKSIRSQHAAAAAAAPQTGSERPTGTMKDGVAGIGAGVAGATGGPGATGPSLLRPEDEKAKAVLNSNAFAAPRTGVPPAVGPGAQLVPSVTLPPGAGPSAGPGAPNTRSPPLGAQQPSNLTAQQTLDKLLGYLATLEQAVLRFPNHKSIPLHSLTTAVAGGAAGAATNDPRQDQEINVLMRLMAALLQQTSRDESSYPKDLVPLTFALKVFKRLYERENRSSLLQIDVHIGVLKCIRAVCPKLLPELTAWLLYADDDRKFILPITAGLLRARLLNTAELDLFLSKLATQIFASGQAVATTTQPNPAAPAGSNATQQLQVLHPQFEFILTLVRRVVVKRPIVSVAELGQLLETLNKIGNQASQQRTKLLADHIAHLLEDVRTAALLAEKERAEQERQLRAGGPVEGLDAKSMIGQNYDSMLNLLPPMSLLDSADEADSLDRMLDEPEPEGLRRQVTYLLDDWTNICLQQGQASDKAYSTYLGILQRERLLATPEATQRFFRVIIQLCVDSALTSVTTPAAGETSAPMSYTSIDALAKLFVFLLKWTNLGGFSGDKSEPPQTAPGQPPQATPNTTASKIALLRSFLSAAVYVLRKDHMQKNAAAQTPNAPASATFNQRPYLRLFNNLLHDLNTPDPLLDSNNVEVLACFAQHFRYLRPQRCPAFLFAWLELISHRMFMSKLLISKTPGCSVLFARLLVDLFRFLQPYLRQADLTEVLRLAYKGTLRLLLVLLHDFPEFLCEFHFSFCDVIPTSCIQMRNLILSAFPRSMRLPDPFTPNLKVDLLPEMTQSPRIQTDISLLLQQPQHRHTLLMPLEQYLKHREPQTFFKQMLDSLTIRSAVFNTPQPNGPATPAQLEATVATAVKRAGTTWNVPLINAVVMYTGLAGINSLLLNTGKNGLISTFQDSASMDVYEALLQGLDAEGRYYVLNAIANQLRFPNNHTHYFSCVLLYLFLQCKDEILMEQMTRVLLERLIVHRPHPWGLLITFIELIKNPRYDFWRQPFTRCAPEIERLFESVARSCMPVKAAAGGGAAAPQPGTNGAALGSSVGAGNSAAAQAMMINDANHAQ